MRTPIVAKTAKDMALSLGVILIPVIIVLAIFSRPADPTPSAVDYAPILAKARTEAPFTVVVPRNLPAHWTPTRARWHQLGQPSVDGKPAAANIWFIGFLSPQKIFFALTQQDRDVQTAINRECRGAMPTGTATAAGSSWQQISGHGATKCLVRFEAGHTTIVSADAPFADLEAFASTLG